MCYAKSERKNRDEVRKWFEAELSLDLAGAMPEFERRFRIGVKELVPILRPAGDGPAEDDKVRMDLAHWDLIPPGKAKPFLRANARSDTLREKWPWKAVLHNRCIVPADGFFEPEKPAMAKGTAPWSYYQLADGGLFAMAALFCEAADPKTGEIVPTYTIITTDANELVAGRKHNRMPAILRPDQVREWLFADDLPDHVLQPFPADRMTGWRVTDRAKNRREREGPDMVEPAEQALLL